MAESVKKKAPKPKPKTLKKPAPKKAAAPKSTATGKAPPKADDQTGMGFPPAAVIKDHAATIMAEKEKLSIISGRIGAAVKNAEKNHNVHRGAMAHVIKLAKMTPEARDEFIRADVAYRKAMGWGVQADLINDTADHSAAPTN